MIDGQNFFDLQTKNNSSVFSSVCTIFNFIFFKQNHVLSKR